MTKIQDFNKFKDFLQESKELLILFWTLIKTSFECLKA